MEGTNEKEPPPLKIDPKCIHEALRAFLLPIKNDDARLDFYTMYKKEATEYDTDYVKKYDEDLNTTLIFAGLFSAVSSAFVLGIQSKLEPDPNDQSAALLRAILLTLNQSAIPGESPTVPPTHEDTPDGITIASCLMYASLLVSLLAAFIAMLGKQWLNRYLRNAGGSMVERCGDRQRKLEGLEKWPFHTFVESLPVMLQLSLLLLACGLCQQMASINTPVASVLVALTALGVLFYLGIVFAGASSYECPFQTPASTALRNSWKEIRPRINLPIICTLYSVWDVVLRQILRIVLHLPLQFGVWHRFCRPRSPNIGEDLPAPRFPALYHLWRKIRFVPHASLRLPRALLSILRRHLCSPPPPIIQNGPPDPQQTTPWLAPKDLAVFLRTNGNDARCVSWILNNITDPEAIDSAVRLAGAIRWFEDQIDTEPPYDAIVSIFEACFDSTKEVYPGLKDRAYHSLRAILWIHALAECKSREFAQRHPIPTIRRSHPGAEDDLTHLLAVHFESYGYGSNYIVNRHLSTLYAVPHGASYTHKQWASNLLLHLAWSNKGNLRSFCHFREFKPRTGYQYNDLDDIPLDATLNRFLIWCIFLGSPVEEDVLRIQDKSDRLERISNQFHQAIITAIAVPPTSKFDTLLPDILYSLTMWKSRPSFLTWMAYDWCSVICERCTDLEAVGGRGRTLLFLSLEIGFRHLDFRNRDVGFELTHTDHHRRMVDVVFKDGSDEIIADFLHAWTSRPLAFNDPHEALYTCAGHLLDLQRLQPLSPRLRHLLIFSIGLLNYWEFEPFGGEKLSELLDHLHVRVEETEYLDEWASFLLTIIRSPEGIRRLSYPYWELLVERTILGSKGLKFALYNKYAHIMESLEDAKEWDKLECWIGVIWMVWAYVASGDDVIAANIESATLSLFHRRPGVAQKIERWIERRYRGQQPDSFRNLCERWRLGAGGQHTQPTSPADGGSGEGDRSLQFAVPLSFVRDDTF